MSLYPEITGRLRAIDKVLKEELHVDSRVERMVKDLRDGLEFLAKKVWALEHPAAPPADPHGHLPGDDD